MDTSIGARIGFSTGWLVAICFALAPPTSAQCEDQELEAGDPGALERFGSSVALRGDTAVVGAQQDGQLGSEAGAAYVFLRSGSNWVQTQKLTSSLGGSGEEFGAAVALWGDTLAVGSIFDGIGSATVFQRDRKGTPASGDDVWVEFDRVTPSVTSFDARFGRSLALHGDTLVVGTRSGNRAFVYERQDTGVPGDPFDDQFLETAVLSASDEPPSSISFSYGWSVGVQGDLVVVGARRDDGAVGNIGSLYPYVRDDAGTPANPLDDTWVERPKLNSAVFAPDGQLGRSVDLEGDTLIGGAFGGLDPMGVATGSAHAFQRERNGTPTDPLDDTWVEFAHLAPPDGAVGDDFGERVRLSGTRALVSAIKHDAITHNAGAVYVYERDDGGTPSDPFDDDYLFAMKLMPQDLAIFDWFGLGLAVDGGVAIVGAPVDHGQPVNLGPGRAFVYDIVGAPLALDATPLQVSAATGGAQQLAVSACSVDAGSLYWVLGSASGTTPGFQVGMFHVALNVDPYFEATLLRPNQPPFAQTLGFLDPGAGAAAAITVPAGFPALAGLELWHAVLLIHPVQGFVTGVSEPTALAIGP